MIRQADGPLAALAFDPDYSVMTFHGLSRFVAPGSIELAQLMRATAPRPSYADWLCESLRISAVALRQRIAKLRREAADLGLQIQTGHGPGGDLCYLLTAAPDRDQLSASRHRRPSGLLFGGPPPRLPPARQALLHALLEHHPQGLDARALAVAAGMSDAACRQALSRLRRDLDGSGLRLGDRVRGCGADYRKIFFLRCHNRVTTAGIAGLARARSAPETVL